MLLGSLDRNQELGYDLRSTISAGLGHYFVRSNRAVVVLGAGLSVNEELPVDGEGVENLDALISFRQSFFTYDYPKTSLTLAADVYPGLSQWGRVRIEFNGSIKREVVHDFTVGLTVYDSYDNKPPTAEARKNDVGHHLYRRLHLLGFSEPYDNWKSTDIRAWRCWPCSGASATRARTGRAGDAPKRI